MRRRTTTALVLLALVATAGCGFSSGGNNSGGTHITVFAASSLTDAFTAIGRAYKSAHHGATVTFSFAGSPDLVAQVQQGAPANVIATASTKSMDDVAKELVEPAQPFARNQLVIVTEKGNPKHIASLADLARGGTIAVLATQGVPAGDYARQALSDAHVTVHPKSLEPNVRGVLTKVELGEADAGIVYVTDALVAGDKVATVPIDNAPIATYPIGAITAAGQPFVQFVLSTEGQAILHRFGFLPP